MNPPDFFIIPYDLITDKGIEPADRMIFAVVYWLEHLKNEKCTASNETLAELACISNRSVPNSLENLEKNGYIERIYKDDGKRNRLEIRTTIAFKFAGTRAKRLQSSAMAVNRDSNVGESTSAMAVNRSRKDKKKKEVDTYSVSFEKFWQAYPRKISKKTALKAWERIEMTDDLLKKMLGTLEKQKQSEQWSKDAGRYIPHPTTWLHQERWEDEVDEKAAPLGGKYSNI